MCVLLVYLGCCDSQDVGLGWGSTPAVLELCGGRIEREITAPALEVSGLGEELAELTLAVCLGATPTQDIVLLFCESGAPFLVGFLHLLVVSGK